MANRPPRGSCEYFKDFYNKGTYEDKDIAGSGITKFGKHNISINEQITILGFKYLANRARRKIINDKTPIDVEKCLPEQRCILTVMFDNENPGINYVGFFDYLEQVNPVSFKSYEKICSNICKSTHLLISETIDNSDENYDMRNENDETSDNDKNNYSIVYSNITSNKVSSPYNKGEPVFTIDEYTKFVDKNKNKEPTELPRLILFVNIDNFVKTKLSYTEWLKTQLKTSPKTDVLPTVELPKTDELQTTVESPKTDTLPTDDDKDGPPPGYDEYNEYDKDPPPGYYDQNYTTVPTGQPSSTGPTSEDDKDPPIETGGARSRRCRKDRKNKSRRCRKSKRRNNKKRRRNTRR